MPAVTIGIMNPIDSANVGHLVEGVADVAGPCVGYGDSFQLRVNVQHPSMDPLRRFVRIRILGVAFTTAK